MAAPDVGVRLRSSTLFSDAGAEAGSVLRSSYIIFRVLGFLGFLGFRVFRVF